MKSVQTYSVINCYQWHHIGLVWDGTNRILLVDEQEVARDEQAPPAIPNGGLMVGTAANPTTGRFWNGLIDDVRIYNRAVKPWDLLPTGHSIEKGRWSTESPALFAYVPPALCFRLLLAPHIPRRRLKSLCISMRIVT